jgi:GNAT superfamily N-acetyltransferase
MALWRIRATVEDRPGYLSVLTASLALKSVNILAVQVHTTEGGAVDEFLVDTPDATTGAHLRAAVEKGRGRDIWVAPAEAQGLVDPPSRALGLAGRLARDPDALGDALRTLLDADTVTWRPSPHRGSSGLSTGVIAVTDPGGGRYEVARSAPPFTPAEYARAQALVEVATAIAERAVDRATVVLPDGGELTVRPATRDDLPAILAMRERCALPTRRRGMLGAFDDLSPERLARLVGPMRGVTLVAAAADGETVVALGSLVVEGNLAELSLVVEDRWQRRGLETAAARRLLAHAERVGCVALIAHVHADDTAIRRTLLRLGRPGPVERDGALVTMTVPIEARRETPAPT